MQPALDERIVLAWNGRDVDGGGDAMLDFLRARKTREIWVVKHSLLRNESELGHHTIDTYRLGVHSGKRGVKGPFFPPATFPLDLVLPKLDGVPVDRWIGFTNLQVARGEWHRRRHGVGKLVYVCVDFSGDRFGDSVVTKAYDFMDRRACLAADEIWPISEVSHEARMRRLNITPKARVHVLPMGAWLERTPHVTSENYARKRLVYIGALIEKQGLRGTIEALALLSKDYELEVYGRGAYEAALKECAEKAGVAERVHFRGFISDHKQLERVLADSTLALACYVPDIASFSKYADPAKLKAYLAAGLPIVLTDVSPNAKELAGTAGAELTEYAPEKIAAAITRCMVSEDAWWKRSRAAHMYMQAFDWNLLFKDAFQLKDEP